MSDRKWWQVRPVHITEHVIAGAILSVLGAFVTAVGITAWLKGETILAAASTVGHAFFVSLPIPVWAFIPLLAFVWFLDKQRTAANQAADAANEEERRRRLDIALLEAQIGEMRRLAAEDHEPSSLKSSLSAEEDATLKVVAEYDGASVSESELGPDLRIPEQVALSRLETLCKKGLLDDSWSALGRLFTLSAEGRTFAIARGFFDAPFKKRARKTSSWG